MTQNDCLSPTSAPGTAENLWLEVRRGQTRVPRRAVRTRRFLIGAGSNCQLQLGGDDVPILHSILLVDEDGAQIDTVVPTPELLVNGVPRRGAQLRDGDVLTIGRFEFAVHIQQPVDAAARDDAVGHPAPTEENSETDLADLSAAAIVDRLEQELREIAQLQSARETGAQALLQAARRHGGQADETGGATTEEAVLLQLQNLSHTLQRRVDNALGDRAGTPTRPHSGLALVGSHPLSSVSSPTSDAASHRKAS